MTLLLGALGWNDGGTAEDGGGAVTVVGGGPAVGAADAGVGCCCAGGAEVTAWKNLLASSFRLGGAAADVAAVEAFEGVGEGAAVDEAVVEGAWAGTEPNALGCGCAAAASFVGGGVPAEPFTAGDAAVPLDAAAEGPEAPFASIVPKFKPECL